MSDPRSNDALDTRLGRLAAAPDRADWDDVLARADASTSPPRAERRFLRLGLAGLGMAAPGAVIAVLLVLSPPKGATTQAPGLTYRTIPAWRSNSVPPAISAAIAKFGSSPLPQSVARVLQGVTFSGLVEVYRAIRPNGTYATLTLSEDQGVRDAGSCMDGTVVVPADPSGAPRRVVVPDVGGLRPEDASHRLREAGLTVRLLDPPPTPPANGIVRGVGSPDTINPPSGTSLFAGAEVAVPAVDRLATPPPEPLAVMPCDLGGESSGHWIVGAVGPDITGGRTEWPKGITVDATVENGTYLLPLLPRDCEHEGPPVALGMTDATGVEVARPDITELKLAESWQIDSPPKCPAPGPSTDATYRVFERASAPRDHVPPDPSSLTDPEAFPVPIDHTLLRAARQTATVGRYGRVTVYVAKPAGRVGACLLIYGDGGVTGFTRCVGQVELARGELISRMQHSRQGDPMVVAGLLPDDFTGVHDGSKSNTLEGNVWVLVYPTADSVPAHVTAIRSDGTTTLIAIPTS